MFSKLPKTAQEFTTLATNYFSQFPKNEKEIKVFGEKLQSVFQSEVKSTQEMWKTYQKATTGDASANEIAKANKTAQELLKVVGFASLIAMPGTIFVLPVLVKMAAEYDIDLVPKSVSKEFSI